MLINLYRFCNRDETQFDLRRPFNLGGWRYATDCRVAVRVPTGGADDPRFDMPSSRRLPRNIVQFFEKPRRTPVGKWHAWPDPAYAVHYGCVCGTGMISGEECTACKGTGWDLNVLRERTTGAGDLVDLAAIESGEITLEDFTPPPCKVCRGVGVIGGRRCHICKGDPAGAVPCLLPIGDVHISRLCDEKIRTLPDVEWFDRLSHNIQLVIRFRFPAGGVAYGEGLVAIYEDPAVVCVDARRQVRPEDLL